MSEFPLLGIPFLRNKNPLDNSFVPVFEHAGAVRHIFPFTSTQVTNLWVPKNEELCSKTLRTEI
jgi:hypothetical protein